MVETLTQLAGLRQEVDALDASLLDLIVRRLDSEAAYTLDPAREAEIMRNLARRRLL